MLWSSIKTELAKVTSGNYLFIVCAMVCGFCIMGDYGIVRPVSHSVFLSTYGSHFFPYVWLAIVPFNFLIIELYNRFLPRIGIHKMFYTILSLIFVLNTGAALFMTKIPLFAFFFYIWKEIYVMLLFQQLWSVIHSTIKMDQAKYLYGIIFACGGLGGILGNSFPGYFAVKIGSANLLLGSLPLLCILGFSFYFLIKNSLIEKTDSSELPKGPQISNFWQGVSAIRNSKYLTFILTIVVVMQVITTLIYYQFNAVLEHSILAQDMRTEYCGKIFGIANIFSLSLQLFGSFLLVHFLGLKRSHIAMPLFLALNAVGSLFFPSFAMISAAFITIKAFDFSLFGVLKEMLYIPLKQDEKFQAKAIIDVFAYRSSKAVASCLILALQFIGFSEMISMLSWSSFALLMAWALIVYKMFKLKSEPALPESE
jgi:AAA family ATP:ADP antiporter